LRQIIFDKIRLGRLAKNPLQLSTGVP